MVASRLATGCCAVAGLLRSVAGQDGVSLLQQGVSEHSGVGAALLERDLASFVEDGRAARLGSVGRTFLDAMADAAPQAELAKITDTVRKTSGEYKDKLATGWKAFYERSRHTRNPSPEELLRNGQLALVQTGAMAEMRRLARASANASRALTDRAVPLDSMLVGFRTSAAPWNNILKMFKMPLIKASFTIFTNFFGPEANAARLCIGAATAVDSEYGKFAKSEFSGINVFIGPAKWDNVPGWSFGTSGGYDNVKIMDVADFGWSWTLAKEPETVCFFYDLCVVTDEELHSNMLQTGSQVQTQQEVQTAKEIPKINLESRHGSTWLQHIWCSPDWFNTPLVIPEDAGSMMKEATGADGKAGDEPPYFKTEEEWDPESEAV